MRNEELYRLFLSFAVSVALFVVAFFLFQLDWLVNVVLYDYGLEFSLSWAATHWTAVRASLALIAFSIITVALTGYASYKSAKENVIATVLVCKSCGNALTKLSGPPNMKRSIPKFKLLETCPFCEEKPARE